MSFLGTMVVQIYGVHIKKKVTLNNYSECFSILLLFITSNNISTLILILLRYKYIFCFGACHLEYKFFKRK